MWLLLHHLFVAAYMLAPVVAALLALFGRRGRIGSRLIGLFSTLFVGLALGTLVTVYYSHLLQSRAGPGQLFLCVYLACSALLIIRGFDALLLLLGMRTRRPGWVAVSLAARGVLLIAIGIPFFMSGLLVYRPKAVSSDTPTTVLNISFDEVKFSSEDALTLSATWIPPRPNFHLDKTVLVAADDTASKTQILNIIRPLWRAGFSALIVDLRSHGNSEGHLTSFGDLERRDVRAAIRWLRAMHPQQASSISGLGIGAGGAALIAAAAEVSAESGAIGQLAVYGAFDDADGVLKDLSSELFIHPLDRWLPAITLPLASATVGANLAHFSPATLVEKIWPRPIFVIHGIGDEIVDFDRGRALFQAASFPKDHLWLQKDHAGTLDDMTAARAVRDFFLTTKPTPAI